MANQTTRSEEAVNVFTLAVALLHNEPIGNTGLAYKVYAKPISPTSFHIWQPLQSEELSSSVVVATCTYDKVAQTWKVELMSGASLTLLDRGSIWEIIEEKRPANSRRKKQAGRPRKRKGSTRPPPR